ncbi:ERF family protein [Viridibacillus sp. NPDC093762]|uniref:ERF family protein n=1 Tax=Viridibacillus sp. NPDC093762 TaxID=3390720 RepID=UPI003CFDCB97
MSKNVYRKLLEARKNISPYLQKGAESKQYSYVSASQVVGAVRKELDNVGLVLMPRIIGHKVTETSVENVDKYEKNKITTTYFTELDLEFVWCDPESGEEVTVPFYSQGVDIAGEKGVGKALTYAEKNFLLKQFNIATDGDDPDNYQRRLEEQQLAPQMSDEHRDFLMKLAEKLAKLRSVNVNDVISKINAYGFESMKDYDFEPVKTNLEHWIANAEKVATQQDANIQPKNETQHNVSQHEQQQIPQQQAEKQTQIQPQQQEQSGLQFVEYSLKGIQYVTTPKNERTARIAVVDENGVSVLIMARQAKLDEANKLDGKENQKVLIATTEQNTFKLLEAVKL